MVKTIKKKNGSRPEKNVEAKTVEDKKIVMEEPKVEKKSKKRKETASEEPAAAPQAAAKESKKAKKSEKSEGKKEESSSSKGVFAKLLNKEDSEQAKNVEVNAAVADLFASVDALPEEENKPAKVAPKSKKTSVPAPAPAAEKKGKKTVSEKKGEKEDKENEEPEEEAEIKKRGGKKGPKSKMNEENRVTPDKRGVVYVGHIPLGFFESQLKTFFNQFGMITRIRLARNRKTGHSKGYGWIEFELEEIADIVAKTMNGYMVENRCLDVKRIEEDKVPVELFKGWNEHKRAKGTQLRQRAIKLHNKVATKVPKGVIIPDDKKIISKRQVRRQSKKKENGKSRLLSKGIEYDPSME